ncbi:MAG: division/cell wall cluster transcriptional repressor MraZ [Candidatus Nealsonbacteria bacterium]|nr:division/cell wall cluster transcriptional repressor MraZ [Candidatus Nealsonbacteria bacterium]
MFIGEYTYSIDDKKRLALPVKFRGLLGKKAVITRGLDQCLFIFSTKEWESLAEKINKLPLSQADVRGFSRLMLGGAMEVSIDSSGRVLVPDYLKKYANLSKKVSLVGVLNRVELWDEETWEKYKGKTEKEGENIAERLKELGI